MITGDILPCKELVVEGKCHICDVGTEFYCCDCDQPVCEDCCVMPTHMNQIDYTICTECGDGREFEAMEYRQREWKRDEEIKAEKERKATARKTIYWTPRNVEKRKAKRAALLVARKEAKERRMNETVNIISSMFKEMF